MSSLAPGALVGGRYHLLGRLGGGASGSVYRATDGEAGPPVAVKLLEVPVGRDDGDMRERFEREARALNGLSHPHLIRILDFGLHEARPYLVTELLEGEPLDRILARRLLPPETAFELGLGVVAGLAQAHAHGVLHRDVKPQNVFVAVLEGGVLHPKLLDFGLARFTDSSRWGAHASLTDPGALVGTLEYMAPERCFGERADARSDVYAAGVLLVELLTGKTPFDRPDRTSLVRAHAADPVPPLSALRPGLIVRAELEEIIVQALAKEKADRMADAPALLRALQSLPEPVATLQ